MEHSPTITKLMKAMLAVQGEVDGVAKDAVNPHFKRRYASLESVTDALRAPCLKAGLVVTQGPGHFTDGCIAISTMIAHAESGEWLRSTLQIPAIKHDPQAVGSALTYGARYSLMALFCLPPVDDDGEAAARPPQPARDGIRVMSGNVQSAVKFLSDAQSEDALEERYAKGLPRTEHWPLGDREKFDQAYTATLARLRAGKMEAAQ